MATKVESVGLSDLNTLAETLLNGPNIDLRIGAARTLVKLGSESAVELLVKALDDGDSTFRARLVKAASKLEQPASTDILIRAINDPDCYVRKSAVESIPAVDHPDIIRALVSCLHDEEINVRESAVIALEKSRDAATVVEVLTHALADSHWNVRREGVEIIAKVGGLQAVEPLKKMLKDEDAEVRMSALVGLADLIGDGVVDSALEALDDRDVSVQLEALDIAGRFGMPAIIPILEQSASREDSSMMVRQAARSAQRRISERASDIVGRS